MKIFYDKNGIKVRSSIKSDIQALKNNLKPDDIREIWSSHNHTPEEALRASIERSVFSATVENGKPIAVFGIYAENLTDYKANIWLLSTEDLGKIGRRFLRNSKYFINMMLEYYPYLENYVDARNIESIQWLKFCGAEISEAKPYGVEGLPFHHFCFRREHV